MAAPNAGHSQRRLETEARLGEVGAQYRPGRGERGGPVRAAMTGPPVAEGNAKHLQRTCPRIGPGQAWGVQTVGCWGSWWHPRASLPPDLRARVGPQRGDPARAGSSGSGPPSTVWQSAVRTAHGRSARKAASASCNWAAASAQCSWSVGVTLSIAQFGSLMHSSHAVCASR
jgi:hypothetical protein